MENENGGVTEGESSGNENASGKIKDTGDNSGDGGVEPCANEKQRGKGN